MLLRLKLWIGALLIVAGGLLAAFGELLNLRNTDPSSGGWFVSMGLIVLGVGVPTFLPRRIPLRCQRSPGQG